MSDPIVPSDRIMPVLAWLHLLAAVAWIGGTVFLSLVLVPILKCEPFASQRGALIRAAALRFRLVVWVAIGALLTTGPLLMLGGDGRSARRAAGRYWCSSSSLSSQSY